MVATRADAPVTVNVRVPVLALLLTVTLKIPAAPGVTGFVPVMLAVTPVVTPAVLPLALSVTGFVSVPTETTLTAYVTVVVLPAVGRVMVFDTGLMASVKDGATITSVAVTVCISDPLVPFARIEYVPGAADADADSVKVAAFPLQPLAERAVTPKGRLLNPHVTVPLNPFTAVAVSVYAAVVCP